MIAPEEFVNYLLKLNITFFTGVPDSLLKDFCAYLSDNFPQNHITADNEGGAVAIAIGKYLSTKEPALVYMQNSGIGNALNPLISLADKDIYGIPTLLLIGWRGRPGTDDEPQHIKQGKITLDLLETAGIKTFILPFEEHKIKDTILQAYNWTKKESNPAALIAPTGIFTNYSAQKQKKDSELTLSREESLEEIISNLNPTDLIVSTTGMISREIYEIRERNKQNHSNDFLCVGGMGHASLIAFGIALNKPQNRIFAIEGDGAVIMHMGHMGIIGSRQVKNLIHIVLNNGAHDSVGGQSTIGLTANFTKTAKNLGYKTAVSIESKEELKRILCDLKNMPTPIFLEIKVKKGARNNLGRPSRNMWQAKENFIKTCLNY